MTWTAPMTAVDGDIFTASQYNTHVRDNLMETERATGTAAGQYFVTTGTNSISPRIGGSQTVNTESATTNSSFGNLPSAGPAVTLTTGENALCIFKVRGWHNSNDVSWQVSVEVSGSTTIAADATRAIVTDGRNGGSGNRLSFMGATRFTDLTPGTNTFTLKYWNTNGSFQSRHLAVIPV